MTNSALILTCLGYSSINFASDKYICIALCMVCSTATLNIEWMCLHTNLPFIGRQRNSLDSFHGRIWQHPIQKSCICHCIESVWMSCYVIIGIWKQRISWKISIKVKFKLGTSDWRSFVCMNIFQMFWYVRLIRLILVIIHIYVLVNESVEYIAYII